MKTIGLLGGLSWESSKEYYRMINEMIKERLGGFNSGKILMYSVNFEEILVLQRQNRWKEITAILVDAARRLEVGGADFILLCTNTMHKMADEIQAGIKVPFIHIADATAAQIKASGLAKVGLLGTRFTMEEEFYKGRLASLHNLEVLIPNESDREVINQVIYGELVHGKNDDISRQEFLRIIKTLGEQGARGIILGCTEIGLLVKQQDIAIPLFDTAHVHAQAAVDLALS